MHALYCCAVALLVVVIFGKDKSNSIDQNEFHCIDSIRQIIYKYVYCYTLTRKRNADTQRTIPSNTIHTNCKRNQKQIKRQSHSEWPGRVFNSTRTLISKPLLFSSISMLSSLAAVYCSRLESFDRAIMFLICFFALGTTTHSCRQSLVCYYFHRSYSSVWNFHMYFMEVEREWSRRTKPRTHTNTHMTKKKRLRKRLFS